MSEASKRHLRPTVTEAVRSAGGCGAVSADGQRTCLLDPDHDGPHGWETPSRHSEALREYACPNWPHPGITGCTYCMKAEEHGLFEIIRELEEQLESLRAALEDIAANGGSVGMHVPPPVREFARAVLASSPARVPDSDS